MNSYIDITSALTPKRKDDGAINHTYTQSVKKIVELTGSGHIKRLAEFFSKTSELEYEYSSSASALCESFWKANEKFDEWERRSIKKSLRILLQDIGFKEQKVHALIGAAELRHRVLKENLFDDGWESNDSKQGLEWIKRLPITSQYTLNRTSRNGIFHAWHHLADKGEKEVTKATLESIQQKYPIDSFERRGRKKKLADLESNNPSDREDFLQRCIVNNDNLPLIDNVRIADKWSIVSTKDDDLLAIVEQKLMMKNEVQCTSSYFEERLREMLDKQRYQPLINDSKWEQLTLAL